MRMSVYTQIGKIYDKYLPGMQTSRKMKPIMKIKINPGMKQIIVLTGMYIKTVNIIILNMLKMVNGRLTMVSGKTEDIKQNQIKILEK